jgi:Na+/H+-dicarboxylate symporter
MQKKSKLTLYIFIALIAGVIVGYVYNTNVINNININISTAEAHIKTIDKKLLLSADTTSETFKALKLQRKAEVKIQQDNSTLREDKLEGFNILSKIFLNLIKMIVAPLVFTTLVVGVAKVGDIKAVGRIGGKTMLWFVSATLVSLLLGMLLVNLFEPGKTMHLPLPDSHLSTGIKKSALSLTEFIGHVFPSSFIKSMANNEILQIVVFSCFLA